MLLRIASVSSPDLAMLWLRRGIADELPTGRSQTGAFSTEAFNTQSTARFRETSLAILNDVKDNTEWLEFRKKLV